MAFFTANKRGKMGSRPGSKYPESKDHSPSTWYGAASIGPGRPDEARRMTNNYGKTAGKRNENMPEVGENSRRTGRMFSWMKGESY